MRRNRSGKPALIFASCILIALYFTGGDFLPANLNALGPGSDKHPRSLLAAMPLPPAPPRPRVVPVQIAPRPLRPPAVPADAGGTCTFDATIYDVRLPPDQVSQLDVDALAKAASTPEAFEKALAALGAARPLYRARQSATMNEEQYVKVTDETPQVAPSSTQPGNKVAFKNTGASFDLIPKEGGAGAIALELAIKVSILLEAPPTAAVRVPIFRTAEFEQHRSVTPGQPFIVINADAATLDANGKAVVFITRVVLDAPQTHIATRPATIP